MSDPSKAKIVWAIDPFGEDIPLQLRAAEVLGAWAEKSPLAIEPVYVMSPDQLLIPAGAFTLVAMQTEAEARVRLHSFLFSTHLLGLESPAILRSPSTSLRAAIEILIGHARAAGAQFILASTQSKKGASRFLFGSFAENLILQSDIPVLLVNPKTKPAPLRHVLFATDLSDKSKQAFHAIVAQAKERGFRVTVYNRFEFISDYSLAPVMASDAFQEMVQQDLQRRQGMANEFAVYARQQGVEADVFIDNDSKESNVAAAILGAVAACHADTIAMASQSGRVASALLGSVTRQVVRAATHPIWIVHSKSNPT